MTVIELSQRATELERKLAHLDADIQELPLHAPMRLKKQGEFDRLSAEYRLTMSDILKAQGQGTLFGAEE
jgi:hypothetical protein